MHGERLSKGAILERDHRFFVAVLSEMDLGNVDTRERKLFYEQKYVVKCTS